MSNYISRVQLTNNVVAEIKDANAQTSISNINNKIGNISNLNTTDKTSVVNSINELVTKNQTLQNNIGNLTNLNTTDKSNLVKAINEVNSTGGGALALIGNLNELNTTDKDSVVDAINETYSRRFTFKTKSDLINTSAPIKIGDVVYVAECDTSYIIESTSTAISLAVNSKYAKLLPDDYGFYNISGLTTTSNQDVLPFINYLITNGHTFFKFGVGKFTLSDTITITGTNTPQFKIHGAGKFNTIINCTKGFMEVSIDSYNFRGSEFIGFTASGVKTGVVGGNYRGFNFISANDSADDMYDNITFKDVLLRYFDVALRISVRCIWNLWEDCDFIYNNYGFLFSKTSADSFFNCNNFINCRFSTNKGRAVTIFAKSGQAVSNNFIGCSIEASYYTNETSPGNWVDLDVENAGVILTGCHFEKASTMPNATAICAVNANVLLNCCFFYNYTSHAYTNSASMLVFNSPSLYGGTSLTAFGTDTGTTVKNNPYTFT